MPLFTATSANNKQFLDEVFVIFRIIKVEVGLSAEAKSRH